MVKVCFACSAGGHLTELLQLKKLIKSYNHFFFTYKKQNTLALTSKEKVFFVCDVNRNPFTLFVNFFQSLQVFIREKPDFVITTGAGACFSLCLIAKIYGRKIINIESFCRVHEPSLFGRVTYPISDLFLVQWSSLLKYYPRAQYCGPVFDLYFPKKKQFTKKSQIFVTVGTSGSFARLIQKIDELAKSKIITNKIIAQIGTTGYVPKYFEYFNMASQEQFEKMMSQSSLVIAHGGVGSIMQSLSHQNITIVVPRYKKYGEHVNDHQLDITKEFQKLDLIIPVYDVNQLQEAIERAKKFKPKNHKRSNTISNVVIAFVESNKKA